MRFNKKFGIAALTALVCFSGAWAGETLDTVAIAGIRKVKDVLIYEDSMYYNAPLCREKAGWRTPRCL